MRCNETEFRFMQFDATMQSGTGGQIKIIGQDTYMRTYVPITSAAADGDRGIQFAGQYPPLMQHSNCQGTSQLPPLQTLCLLPLLAKCGEIVLSSFYPSGLQFVLGANIQSRLPLRDFLFLTLCFALRVVLHSQPSISLASASQRCGGGGGDDDNDPKAWPISQVLYLFGYLWIW